MDGWEDSVDGDRGGRAGQLVAGHDFVSGRQADADAEVVTVGLIGAGRGITPLLSRMLEYDYIDVLMVVDDDPGVQRRLIEELQRTQNQRTSLLNPLATRFIMSLAKDARELLRFVPRARLPVDYGFGLDRGT